MEQVTLSNGVKMPLIGYGSLRIADGKSEQCVREALEIGYRLIDTAQYYMNEEEVGRAVKNSGIARDKLFITTKVWISNTGGKTLPSIEESLKKLQTDYVDLLLIHEPYNDYYSIWRGIEQTYREGKVRAIGISNFYPDRLMDFLNCVDIKPMVIQLEGHVFQQQREERKYLDKYGIQMQAWSPLARGKNNIFSNPVLSEIARSHNKTVGQVALRFLVQNNIAVIPKTVRRERMVENISITDFELTAEEMKLIETLDGGKNIIMNHRDPLAMEAFFANANANTWKNV